MTTLTTTAEIAATTQAAVTEGQAYIVHIRLLGAHGGQGLKLRFTPPDEPPAPGSLWALEGKSYRVLDVYEEGEG